MMLTSAFIPITEGARQFLRIRALLKVPKCICTRGQLVLFFSDDIGRP